MEDLQGLPRGAALRGLRAERSHDRPGDIGVGEEIENTEVAPSSVAADVSLVITHIFFILVSVSLLDAKKPL